MMNLIEKYLNKVNPDLKKNILREFLQTLILKLLYASKYNNSVIFMGGTCLRICYDIPRFSEDLDFNLSNKKLDFLKCLDFLKTSLNRYGLKVDAVGKQEKTVYKGFIKFSDILFQTKISPLKSEKLSIKLKIDSKPQKNFISEINIISKFGFNFIIKNADLSSMMAGKIHACFSRGYFKGRDFYDLLWYLNRKIVPNFKLLNEFGVNVLSKSQLIKYLSDAIKKVEINKIIKDVYPFLENKDEIIIIENIKKLFPQITKRYLI